MPTTTKSSANPAAAKTARRRFARTPASETPTPVAPAPAPAAAAPSPQTKIGLVTTLLERKQGATMPELMEATGWLKHSTSAALTRLRHAGYVIERTKADDASCYRITGKAE